MGTQGICSFETLGITEMTEHNSQGPGKAAAQLKVLENFKAGDPGKLQVQQDYRRRRTNCGSSFHMVQIDNGFGSISKTPDRIRHSGELQACLYDLCVAVGIFNKQNLLHGDRKIGPAAKLLFFSAGTAKGIGANIPRISPRAITSASTLGILPTGVSAFSRQGFPDSLFEWAMRPAHSLQGPLNTMHYSARGTPEALTPWLR